MMKHFNKKIIGLVLLCSLGTLVYASPLEKQLQKLRQAGIPTTIEELNFPEIPDEKNGALVYREVFNLLDSLREKYKEEWAWIDGFDIQQRIVLRWDKIPKEKKKKVTDLILHNPEFAKFYQLLKKASRMKCGFISREGYQKQGTRHLSWLRACARAIKKKMQIEAEYGEIDKALSASLTGLKITKSLSNDCLIISQLVRIAIDGIALKTLEESMNKGEGSIELYQSLINEMEKERKDNLMNCGLKGEIIIFKLYLFSHYRKAGKKAFEFTEEDKKEIEELFKHRSRSEEDRKNLEERIRNQKKALNEAYLKSGCKDPETFFDEQEIFYLKTMSKIIPLTKGPYWEVKDKLEKIHKEVKETPPEKAILTQRRIGSLPRVYFHEAKIDALLGAAEIGIANRIYKIKHGKYVDNLNQLTPEILSSLPLDSFTGKNYIYKKKDKGFIVYSVGEDLKDNGGVEERGLKPDIVWSCEK